MKRVSRLPVRESGTSRSSSGVNSVTKRRSKSNQNHLVANYTPQSARARSTTPSSSYGRQKSPLIKKDKRPLDSKKWQIEQTSRVEAFVRIYEPTIAKLRPPTINTFLTVLHVLFSAIDDSIQLTMENYQSELPDLLRLMKYPSKLTPSTIKYPNTPHAYPHILGIWSYLLDLIDHLQTPLSANEIQAEEDIEINQYIDKIAIKSFGEYQGQMIINSAQIEKDMKSIFIKNPKDHNKVEKELEVLKKNIKEKDGQIKKVNAEIEEIDTTIQTRKNTMKTQRDSISKTKKNFESLSQKLENCHEKLAMEVRSKQVELKVVEAKLGLIKNSKESVLDTQKQINEKKFRNDLLKERKDHLMMKVSELDLKVAQQKRETEATIFRINNTLMDQKHLFDDIDQFILPEKGLGNPQYLELLKSKDHQQFAKKLLDLEKSLEMLHIEKEAVIKKKEEKIKTQRNEYTKKQAAFEHHNDEMGKLRQEAKVLEEEIEVVESSIIDLDKSRVDITHYEGLCIEAQERYDKLREATTLQEEEIEEYKLELHKTVFEIQAKLMDKLKQAITFMQLQKEAQSDYILQMSNDIKAKVKEMEELAKTMDEST